MTDITKYPEGPNEIIKYMDFLPDEDKIRTEFLIGFMILSIIEIA